MPPFRRVSDDHAGPSALGILVPPGRRTFLILRPRALAWDLVLAPGASSPCDSRALSPANASARELLLVSSNGGQPPAPFRHLDRNEAPRLAEEVFAALVAWTAGGPGRVEVIGTPSEGHRVRVEVGAYVLLLCQRLPGQPYQPRTFARADEAQMAATELAAVLHPAGDAGQEVYFNLRNFGR